MGINNVLAIISSVIMVGSLIIIPVAATMDGVGPGDLLYPVDLAMEDIQLTLAGNPNDKITLLSQYMDERLDEIGVDENSTDNTISEAMDLYQEELEKLAVLVSDICEQSGATDNSECEVKGLTSAIATLKHTEVLANIYDMQVEKGNENAANSILNSMEKSLTGHDKIMSKLEEKLDPEYKETKNKMTQKVNSAKERRR